MKINFNEEKNGFSAFVSGVSNAQIKNKIDACKNGTCGCDCDPSIMKKIENIEVLGSDETTQIKITGDVSSDVIAPMMQKCLTGE